MHSEWSQLLWETLLSSSPLPGTQFLVLVARPVLLEALGMVSALLCWGLSLVCGKLEVSVFSNSVLSYRFQGNRKKAQLILFYTTIQTSPETCLHQATRLSRLINLFIHLTGIS